MKALLRYVYFLCLLTWAVTAAPAGIDEEPVQTIDLNDHDTLQAMIRTRFEDTLTWNEYVFWSGRDEQGTFERATSASSKHSRNKPVGERRYTLEMAIYASGLFAEFPVLSENRFSRIIAAAFAQAARGDVQFYFGKKLDAKDDFHQIQLPILKEGHRLGHITDAWVQDEPNKGEVAWFDFEYSMKGGEV